MQSVSLAIIFSICNVLPVEAAQVTSSLLVDINVENPSSYSGTGNVANDLAGATNSAATLQNSPTYEQGIESGIKLNGINQYLRIPDASELRLAVGNVFTYTLWAKVETYTAGDALFSKEMGSGGWDGFDLSLRDSNSLRLFFNGGLAQSVTSGVNSFSLNTWTLFTAVLRFGGGSGNLSRIYVNGTQVATLASTDTNVGTTTASIAVGGNYEGAGNYPGMTVGALAIYNKELTAAEVATTYDYYANYFNDISSISLSSSSNIKKGQLATISATVGARGTVRFFINGKRIAGCINVPVSMASYPLSATCSWKPTSSGLLTVSARLSPTTAGIAQTTSFLLIQAGRRSNNR